MSDYIENRVSSLENRVSDIERHYNGLHVRVNDLEDNVQDNDDDFTILSRDLGRMEKEIEGLRFEVRGTEYLDPLTDKPVDQSTEEFVKVVRCKDCNHYDKMVGFCLHGICVATEPDDYCSRGEKR